MKEPEKNSFLQKKTQNFRSIFFLYYRELLFFAGIFGIIFPVQKLTGIFPVNGSVIAGTHLCPRDREMLPGCPQEKLPGKTHHRKKGKPCTRTPCRRQETGRPGSSAESALPSASAGHRPPEKDRQQPEGSLFLPEIPAVGKKRSGRDPKEGWSELIKSLRRLKY